MTYEEMADLYFFDLAKERHIDRAALTAEQRLALAEAERQYEARFRKREWKKIRPRNEALDCRVYALAAYALLNANINQIVEARGTMSPQ